MAIRFLSSETIDGSLTVSSTVTLNKTNNVISIPSLVDNGTFLEITQTGNETWLFKCESLSGSLDGVTIGTTAGKVAFDENGQIHSTQLLDVATAGGRLIGESSRGYLSSIHLEQSATGADGGNIRFETAPSGTTSGVERLRITDTGAFSVGSTGTNYGTSGQVLTSGGNSNPTWTTPTTGDISGSGVAGEVAYFTGTKTIANNAGMSFSNQQIQFDGIGGADGYILPYDQNPGYSNMAAGGFGLLFREAYDSYVTNNTYYYKTGGTSQWRAKYTTKGASVLSMLDGKFNFDTAPANTTSPYNLSLSTRMTILEGGNVGIGTTLPGNKLTIASGTGGGSAPDSRTLLHIDKDGEAYISINSPAESFNGIRLNVAGTPKAFMELYDNTAQGKKLNIGTVDARDLVFDTGNQPKMTIVSAGNVGIGTSSPDQTGYGYKTLTIMGGTTAGYAGVLELLTPSTDANGQNLGIVSFGSGGTRNAMIGAVRQSGNNNAKLQFWTAAGANGIENRMTIDADGQVGIGTDSPQYKLDVDGQIRAEGIVNIGGIGVAASGALANVDINDTDTNGTSTSYQPNITFKAAGVLKAQIGKLSNSTNYFTAAKNFDGPVNIIASEIHSGHTHSQEYIFGYEPANSGNTWGLNIVDTATTPNSIYIGAEGLHSTSSIFFGGYVNALLVTRISLNQTLGTWLYDCPDAGTSNVSVKWRKYNIGGYMANMIDFEDDGDIKNINGSYGTISSDERVKENIVEATSKLDDILSLKVKNFNFIGDNKKQIGLIAQEVEEVFPSWVTTSDTRIYKTHDEHGVPLEEQGELVSGYEDGKGLKVGMEFAVLVKTIQELNAKIVALESRINEM